MEATNPEDFTGEELERRLNSVREEMSADHALRLHRAISWLQCAEHYAESDDDLTFITLWIAFNACISVDDTLNRDHRQEFAVFAGKLVPLDESQHIYNILWNNFSDHVRLLIGNQYIFGPYWRSVRVSDERWKLIFEYHKKRANRALGQQQVTTLLSIVMEQLYVLRNQLVHGGATYRSGVNRQQVSEGKQVLMKLLPVFLSLMFDESVDWGQIRYPLVSSA